MAKIIKKPNELKSKYRKTLLLSLLFHAIAVFGIVSEAMYISKWDKIVLIAIAVATVGFAIAARILWRRSAILKAGLDGESDASKVVAALPDSYCVFQNLKVKYKGRTSETDIVVVGPSGIFIVETKNLAGSIFGNCSNSDWTQKKPNGSVKRFYSPVKQVSTHVFRLANYLRENGFRVRLEAAVYFANPETELDISNVGEVPVFCAMGSGNEQLLKYIKSGSRKITPSEKSKIISLLEKLK